MVDPESAPPPSDASDAHWLPDELAATLLVRKRWLGALLADPRNILLQYDAALASLITPKGERIALLTYDREDAVARRLDALFGAVDAKLAKALVFGGELSSVERLTAFRSAALAHVTADGGLRQLTGKPGSTLEAAAQRLPAIEPPSEVAIGQALSRGQPLQRAAMYFSVAVARGTPLVTGAIAAVCIVLFALGYYWSGNEEMIANWRMGANHGELVLAGEWWRVLASAFLHGSLLHLFVNMLALISLGRLLERVLGAPRYLALYGLSALAGGLASAALTPSGSVGASGAIWGLLGAALGLTFRPQGLLPEIARDQMRKRAWSTLFINVAISFLPGIDRYAHFGGGLAGAALVLSGAVTAGVSPLWDASRRTRGSLAWGLLGALLSAAMALSVTVALLRGTPWALRGPVEYERVALDVGLSLELPKLLHARPPELREGGVRAFPFGQAPEDPLLVDIATHRLESPPDGAERSRLLGELLAHEAKAPEGFRVVRAPHLQEVAGHPFVHARLEARFRKGLTIESWHTALGDLEVRVEVVSLPGRSEAFRGVETRLLESLAATR